jgi:hypothetical protein
MSPARERIYAAVVAITLDMLQHAWDEIKYHLDVCSATGDPHIET